MPENKNKSKKKSLRDVVGILGPISDEIKKQAKGKTFDQIREEAISKHFQEKYGEYKLDPEGVNKSD
ncbi:hypothetical protein SLT67_04630 [Paenibacillus illinoisensis]|uniref:hypothetical protein n=1 Tax=Paenibacillus illinoisensis TaxID=59845 RepID=UPI003CEECDD6